MTIRWGIIGFGAIADKCTAPAMLEAPGSALVSLMCRSMDKARLCAQKYGVPKYWDNADELIADREIDAVYIATPVSLHCPYAVAAARAGKHVLVEKPMAVSASECWEMIQACTANNVKLMVCFYQRFNARHQKMRELLAGGALGKLSAARIQFTQYHPYTPAAWRYDPRHGGGSVMDTGSHCIDLLRFLLAREVVQVAAVTNNLMFHGPVEDTASIVLCFDDGTQSVITTHFSSPAWDQTAANVVEVYGERGVMIAAPINDKFSRGELRWNVGQGWESYQAEQSTHVAMLEAFTQSIESDTPPPVTGADGLANMRIIEAIYQSSRERRFIRL